jgi:hypothetical protein
MPAEVLVAVVEQRQWAAAVVLVLQLDYQVQQTVVVVVQVGILPAQLVLADPV